VLTGAVTVQTNTLDPAALRVGGKTYSGTQPKLKLTPGKHTVSLSQADYDTLKFSVTALPFTHKTIAVHPQLTPLGQQKHAAREFASNFAQRYGTYSYQNFTSYAASMQPLMSPQLYGIYFAPDFLPQREDTVITSQFSITTTPTSTSLTSYSDSAAVVMVNSQTKAQSSGKTDNESETQIITLAKSGAGWIVIDLSVKGAD
jgi:hypothetical protein